MPDMSAQPSMPNMYAQPAMPDMSAQPVYSQYQQPVATQPAMPDMTAQPVYPQYQQPSVQPVVQAASPDPAALPGNQAVVPQPATPTAPTMYVLVPCAVMATSGQSTLLLAELGTCVMQPHVSGFAKFEVVLYV